MAAKSGGEAATKGLSEEDLGALCEALHPISKKYKFLGLQIGVKKSEIETIEAQHGDPGERLLEVLSVRLKKAEIITWGDIDKALRSACVGEIKVAESIREEYGHLFSKGSSPQEHDTKRKKRKGRRGESPLPHGRGSDRQEEDSEREVSGQVHRKKYPQPLSSKEKESISKVKKARQKIEESSPHHTPHKERVKRKDRKNKNRKEKSTKVQSEHSGRVQKEKRGKQKEKAVRCKISETESSDNESINQTSKQQKVKAESEDESSASSSEEEAESLPIESETRGKSGKSDASAKHTEKKSELKRQERKGKKIQRKEKDRHQRAADERAQYSDGEEVRKKPTHRSKSESVSENESSIASSTEEETSESEIPSVKIVSDTHSEKKYHDKGIMKAPKEKRIGKKQKTQSEKEHFPPCSMKEQDLERKRTAHELDESIKAVSREKYLKIHSKQHKDRAGISRERADVKEKKAAARHSEPDTAGSDSTQDDSEGEGSEDGGKDEEDRDLQQRSSSEEEDVPEDKSSASTSEEEVLTKSKRIAPTEKQRVKEKESGKGKDRRVTADDDQSDRGGRSRDQEEHDIQSKKKRGRRRHREGGASPTTRGSSSPSTSQEEKNQQPDPGGQRRKREHGSDNTKKKRKERKQGEEAKSPSASETGDSSPECDMIRNLSKADRKKLVKMFKQFFGQLCCEITNPVQIAAQLQKKGLISHSMMKDMIVSPESRQAKTIGLVGALDKKIKSHPDRLFLFIDILLEDGNPQLQQAGREMLEKTGEICPDRKFPIKPTLSQTATPSSQAAGNKQEAQPNKVERSNSQIVPAIGGDGTLSSLEVSLYVPQSGLSPVLTMYKGYLKSYYNARTLAPADKYLPTLKVPYINLAMVGREYRGPEQRDEFTRQTLHGGVDQILQSKTPISIEDMLTPEDSDGPVRFILVEGPPGIGKSTFSWEVCRRWDEIGRLKDYHTVVLLRLREKWVLNATSPSDLFRFPPDPELSKAIARELNSSHGHKLLLILDGFDEVSHSFHENSVIKSILCRQLLPECTIILTTRPVAKYTLECVCQPEVDKHIEIIGFTEEERVRYITEVFSKEPELQVNFLKYMFLVPHIKSMMYIPLNCAIIAQVYYESQSSHHLAIPRTRTQLYKALTNSLLVRHMKMTEGNHEYTSMLPEGLDDAYREMFKILAKFAFDSYHKDEERKVTFFTEDIPEGLVHFGLMNESTEMYASQGIGRTFSFLHLSLQEYLAAWHLADNYSVEFQVAYHMLAIDNHLKNLSCSPSSEEEEALIFSLMPQMSSLKEPAIFLAGITGWRSKSKCGRNHWEMYLSHDTTARPHELLPSLYEAQNPDILPHYFAGESSSMNYQGYVKTPYESYALSYCLAYSSYQLPQLNIYTERENTSLLETFVKGLDDHCKTATLNVQELQVSLYTNPRESLSWLVKSSSYTNPHKSLSWLVKSKLVKLKRVINRCSSICSAQVNFLQSLVCVEFLKLSVNSVESWEWLSALQSLSELKMLHISTKTECSPLPTNLVCWLIEHRLITLGLDIKFPSNTECNVRSSTDILVDSVLMSLLSANRITELTLSDISRETMAGVHSILLHCPSLTTLKLKRTRLGYDGILYICSALKKNVTLRNLTIFDSFAVCLFTSRHPVSFSSMKEVSLPSRITCTDFLLELNNILMENTTLRKIKIQSGLFFPLSVSAGRGRKCHQWTGLGPLQQFNMGAVGSGMSPNLRRSFSSSDLSQPQTTLFWNRRFYGGRRGKEVIDFRRLFSEKQKKGKKLFSLPSFTAPDTEVLQSFSGLDPRLKECLNMSHLNQYVKNLSHTYMGLLYYLSRGCRLPLLIPRRHLYTIEFKIC